jgi:hypothetical protein
MAQLAASVLVDPSDSKRRIDVAKAVMRRGIVRQEKKIADCRLPIANFVGGIGHTGDRAILLAGLASKV